MSQYTMQVKVTRNADHCDGYARLTVGPIEPEAVAAAVALMRDRVDTELDRLNAECAWNQLPISPSMRAIVFRATATEFSCVEDAIAVARAAMCAQFGIKPEERFMCSEFTAGFRAAGDAS